MNLLENGLIEYVDIGIDQSSKLIQWKSNTGAIPRLDIISARSSASEKFYKRSEKGSIRTVFKKKCEFTFIIAGNSTVQYQLLEAIIEQLIEDFFGIYGENACFDYVEGMTNMFDGFEREIPNIISDVEQNRVEWVRSYCKLCGVSHRVCVKKSLIEKAKNYPVSLVYFHQGHGVLLHIDANFKVRGTELVNISG